MTSDAPPQDIPAPRAWSRAELALAGTLLLLATLSWWVTSTLAMPAMGLLTPMPMESMPAAFFLITWVVMMAAMMLPAITPFTVGVRRLVRARQPRRGTLAALTLGYLLLWSAAGVLAYAILRVFDTIMMSGAEVSVRAGGVVLLGAGLYQFTPLKRWCLTRCRSPLFLVVRHGEALLRGRAGALGVGVYHGAYCLGCCWALMLVQLALGAMSLVWMAVVAAVMTVEKALPRGEVTSHALGGVLVAAGMLLMIWPTLVL
ncbi:putative metal-binding membrane protein [Saccharopolyspora erythraea NRRL 2338]|uniref:Uncharacterized protein n=2 Tax=Saccharopolyspora erythraea TaxID=1836 RepID=A4FCX2_SACEN|nr:DUF2182 domain-containing protein [Saccharopolyspora erythraea]EQD82535.1 metal-binding protein [Saccharopolyspora erythraea D]PFG95646.1 putative metal-binding membrane protein [Saccharopolyspora erythraea NRRL 2338]QRK92248.1 DUF2182 domain-containing protein [Saccharopolyspora erythraea]CAM01897.1 hypothetical protein SACE_2612 [Saccharopolyspora erythraea NRRL 2338]